MKKETKGIIGLFVGGMLMLGCAALMEEPEEPSKPVAQEVVVKETKEIKEELIKEEEIKEELIQSEEETFNKDELISYLSGSHTMDELDAYFNNLPSGTEVTIPVTVLDWNEHEKYDTRYEMLLGYGDGSSGPVMKTRDLSYTGTGYIPDNGATLTVTIEIDKYERDYDWIKVDVKEINR